MSTIIRTKPAAVKSTRPARRFGEGLGERYPIHRSPVSTADLCWWELETQREQDRLFDRMAAEFEAQERIDAGLDC